METSAAAYKVQTSDLYFKDASKVATTTSRQTAEAASSKSSGTNVSSKTQEAAEDTNRSRAACRTNRDSSRIGETKTTRTRVAA